MKKLLYALLLVPAAFALTGCKKKECVKVDVEHPSSVRVSTDGVEIVEETEGAASVDVVTHGQNSKHVVVRKSGVYPHKHVVVTKNNLK